MEESIYVAGGESRKCNTSQVLEFMLVFLEDELTSSFATKKVPSQIFKIIVFRVQGCFPIIL
jgi:hypothetical protein